MQLNLEEHMKTALSEVLSEGRRIAEAANDVELTEEYDRFLKNVSQGHYRRFSSEDVETIWYLCETGAKTCEMLLETAETPEQFEKTAEVKDIYESIKRRIMENSVKKRMDRIGASNERR